MTSNGAEELSALIADIYDAAINPSLWVTALEKLCGFVPGRHANIFIQDGVQRSANALFTWGDDPHYHRLYLEQYARINPLFPALLARGVGEVFAANDVVPLTQFRRSRFYKEWQRPQGLVDGACSILEKSQTSAALLAVPRHETHGMVDAAARRRMGLVVPHVQRAVLIGKAIDLQNAAATLADAFDSLSAAVYLVDAGGRIVHANRGGALLLADEELFSGAGDQLRARDADADRTLREMFTVAGTGNEAALGAKGVALALISGRGERYLAHVLPLTSGSRRLNRPERAAVAAVFVHKAALHRPSVVDAVAARFALTPTELRVLFCIVEVGGVPDVAPVLGISQQTVRTHLKQLFAKTGTRRQADLVKLVAEFANPLVA